jgi:hypothetical protein
VTLALLRRLDMAEAVMLLELMLSDIDDWFLPPLVEVLEHSMM